MPIFLHACITEFSKITDAILQLTFPITGIHLLYVHACIAEFSRRSLHTSPCEYACKQYFPEVNTCTSLCRHACNLLKYTTRTDLHLHSKSAFLLSSIWKHFYNPFNTKKTCNSSFLDIRFFKKLMIWDVLTLKALSKIIADDIWNFLLFIFQRK